MRSPSSQRSLRRVTSVAIGGAAHPPPPRCLEGGLKKYSSKIQMLAKKRGNNTEKHKHRKSFSNTKHFLRLRSRLYSWTPVERTETRLFVSRGEHRMEAEAAAGRLQKCSKHGCYVPASPNAQQSQMQSDNLCDYMWHPVIFAQLQPKRAGWFQLAACMHVRTGSCTLQQLWRPFVQEHIFYGFFRAR